MLRGRPLGVGTDVLRPRLATYEKCGWHAYEGDFRPRFHRRNGKLFVELQSQLLDDAEIRDSQLGQHRDGDKAV
ncbi:MAG: hypothetical protein U0231_16860 [Nitrospiraceae bacterium]